MQQQGIVNVRLFFNAVSEITGNRRLGVIILTNASKTRQLSIVCEHNMAIEIDRRKTANKLNELLCPEALVNLLRKVTNAEFEIHISDIVNGQYKVYIFNRDNLDITPIRASDAILLAVAAGLPIFIEQNLMLKQSVEYKDNTLGVTIPINSLSLQMLEESLLKAIKTEDYETASKLRDEIKKRKRD